MNIFGPVPIGKTLSILPTFRCTAACQDCGSLSSPSERTRLHLNEMLGAIDEASTLGYEVVVFTGGEPTLIGKELETCISRASSHGLIVRMVTNAYWAIDDKKAKRRVEAWKSAGLREINFSTGDQHARFVPIERVINATRAAISCELPVAIMVETTAVRNITKEVLISHPLFVQITEEYPGVYIRVDESPWMPLSPSIRRKYPDGIAVNRSNLSRVRGCDSVLRTTTIEADGKINACCGLSSRMIPELQTGKLGDSTIQEADRKGSDDFLKHWISVEGPERILAWAEEHNDSVEWEDMYAHRCQACLRIYKDPLVRQIISENHQEKLADVIFSDWLVHHFDPGDQTSKTVDHRKDENI